MDDDYIKARLALENLPADERERLQYIVEERKAKELGITRMISILKSLGISMSVSGCGCCGSPGVDFSYQGEDILSSDDANFNTDLKE